MWSLYMTILTMVGFISGVSMETCPTEDISPCVCYEYGYITVDCASGVYLKLYDLESLHQAVSRLSGKQDVLFRLNHFKVKSILSNLFSGVGVNTLDFQDCRLDRSTHDDKSEVIDLSGFGNDLAELRIVRSSTVPQRLHLGNLKKLITLHLYGNNLTEIRDDWLGKGVSSLETLYIRKSNVTWISDNAFSQLINVKTFTFEDNRLGRIKRSMFPRTADKLRYLILNNNAITDLSRDFFRRMPNVVWVSLSRNQITTIDERTWSPIWKQLADVTLDGNNIYCDHRLRWITKFEHTLNVVGECRYPKEFEGMSLNDFLFGNVSGVLA